MDNSQIRERFPALSRLVNGREAIYFDGPGGSQVPLAVAERMSEHILDHNANASPHFATGQETIAMVGEVRQKVARFLNCSADEVSFGQNMTSLTFAFSRALAQTWREGDNVIVSEMDHDSNITSWALAARDRGVEVRMIPYNKEKGTIDPADIEPLLDDRTRLIAITYSSNLIGSHVDIPVISAMAHAAGAQVYVDAVHHAPHYQIDTQELDCDYLVCSAYKFFGPHIGILFGRSELMNTLSPYKIEPAPVQAPSCWETGTQNYAAMAGLGASLDYILSLAGEKNESFAASYACIREAELPLCEQFLKRMNGLKGYELLGIQSNDHRAPTFALVSERHNPDQLARYLGEQGVFTWSGHMYAVQLIDALGLKREDGVLRIGLMHYNRIDEVDSLFDLLETATSKLAEL